MGETTGGVLRRGSDRIIGSVCSGLATYFGVDALLVRIVFVILALIPPGIGIGIILYLVLWFLMEPPQGAPTSATRNIGARLRAMGDELREDFRTGFRSQASDATTPSSPTGGPAGSPPPAGTPVPPPSHGGWWGPPYRDRPRGLYHPDRARSLRTDRQSRTAPRPSLGPRRAHRSDRRRAPASGSPPLRRPCPGTAACCSRWS